MVPSGTGCLYLLDQLGAPTDGISFGFVQDWLRSGLVQDRPGSVRRERQDRRLFRSGLASTGTGIVVFVGRSRRISVGLG